MKASLHLDTINTTLEYITGLSILVALSGSVETVNRTCRLFHISLEGDNLLRQQVHVGSRCERNNLETLRLLSANIQRLCTYRALVHNWHVERDLTSRWCYGVIHKIYRNSACECFFTTHVCYKVNLILEKRRGRLWPLHEDLILNDGMTIDELP